MLYRNFATQDEIDAQYELERAVKDSRQYGEQFTRERASARRELNSMLDLRFGPTVDD